MQRDREKERVEVKWHCPFHGFVEVTSEMTDGSGRRLCAEPWCGHEEVEAFIPAEAAVTHGDLDQLRGDIEAAESRGAALREALDALDRDGHRFTKRPCGTCAQVTVALVRPFGCDRLRQAALHPEPGKGERG